MHLDIIAQRVKEGVHAAGGIPFEFSVPAPATGSPRPRGDAIRPGQRDLIADIIETHVRSMMYDSIVFVASCDKIVPGMLMAAARLKLPTIFIRAVPTPGTSVSRARSRAASTAPPTPIRGTSSRRPPARPAAPAS